MAKQKKARTVTTEERTMFTTLEEAQASRPKERPSWRLFAITSPDGEKRFTWGSGRENIAYRVAVADGYGIADSGKVPSKEKVASLLASLNPEDRASLLAMYKGKGK
jgi:hypothetical protein